MSALGRLRARPTLAALAAVLAIGGAAPAQAAEPAADNPLGATAVVDPSTVVQGGTLSFRGTGFTTNGRGEVINVRIDDKATTPVNSPSGVWATFTAAADGTVSGTIDLSRAHPDTPILPGRHWIRLLTGSGAVGDTARTLHADFTVVAAATDPGATGGSSNPGTTTPGAGTTTPTTPTESKPNQITPNGVVWLTDPVVKLTKTKKKIALKVRAGAVGSAGKVSVRTKDAFKVGKGKAKRQLLARSTAYFVDRVSAATLNLALTPDGKTLLTRKGTLKAVVTLVDANGEDTIVQEVTVQR